MKKLDCIKLLVFAVFIALVFGACRTAGGDNPGKEYMPDMFHSIAYEANYYDYYSFNTWGSEEDYYKMAKPREPVAGTIPRGYAGVYFAQDASGEKSVMNNLTGGSHLTAISVPVNGSVPYYYEDTEEERTRATAEIINNPYPITTDGLATGKNLYLIYCGVCHGEKGDGNGYLVAEENTNAKYQAQPANFLTDDFVTSSNGRYYHSIMYGKNVMGAYADKLSYKERWQVIHYIRSLQAKEKKLAYNENENTLNAVEVPYSKLEKEEHGEEAGLAETWGVSILEGEHHGDKGEHKEDHH